MKTKKSKAITVLKGVAKLEMDEIILRKSSLVEQEEWFAQDEKRLLDSIRNEAESQRDDILWHQTFSKFKDGVNVKLHSIRMARNILQTEIEKLTAQILELHIEQKKYAKIQEIEELKQIKEMQKQEQKDLDRLGIMKVSASV